MKKGKSLIQLAQELEAMRNDSKDYVVPVEHLTMSVDTNVDGKTLRVVDALMNDASIKKSLDRERIVEEAKVAINNPGRPVMEFPINGETRRVEPTTWAHQQIATLSGMPKAYYDRLVAENAPLLAANVNHGLTKNIVEIAESPRKADAKLVRTVGNNMRAVLSSRYRCLDNFDLMEATLPTLIDRKFDVRECEITDRRMYVRAFMPSLEAAVKVGDVVRFGVLISGSDVGSGSVRIEPYLLRLVCMNGMVSSAAIKKMHIGRDQSQDGSFELLTDETKALTDAAFWASVRDVLVATTTPEWFEREVVKLREASEKKITGNVQAAIEVTAKTVGITGEDKKASMIEYLANGADGAGTTQWGIANAITRIASDVESFDESIDLERAANKVIELSPKDWKKIADAA